MHAVVRHLREAGHAVVAGHLNGVVATGLSHDSRLVHPGDLYAALPGRRYHGGDFAAEAAARGAVVALSDRPCRELPTIVVDHPRRALGPLASWAYHHPSARLDLYGVTGTNGKTSTAYLLEAGLAHAGLRTGLVTGITVRGPDGARPSNRTTPEACDLQRILADFAGRVDAVAMEVSSHGLAEHRVDGTHFRVAVFTNLARDHLDFHTDMQAYFSTKARLFAPERCERAAIGIDDDYGRRLAADVGVPRLTFSLRDPSADLYADAVQADRNGTSFTVHRSGTRIPVRLRLLGRHQADNALAALTALAARGVDLDAAVRGVESVATVPGRLERVDAGQPFLAFVDYVHNTAGQRRLFPYLRSLTGGKIIVVIGATGERDPGKRAPLGFTAARLADSLVVTSESTFSEDGAELRNNVAEGARRARHADVVVVPDRGDAIRTAVSLAGPDDVVVVSGRGHDPVLNEGGTEIDFDDRIVLRAALYALSDR